MFFRKMFGTDNTKNVERKPIQPASNSINTLSQLKKTSETLEKRKNHLSIKMNGFMKKAREKMKKGDKRGAMLLLKKKKMYEKEIAKIEGSQMNLENQIITIESMYTNKLVFDNLKNTNNCIKHLNSKMNIDDVEDMHDDLNEAIETSNEVGDLMSRPIGEEFDEDELLEELTMDSMTDIDLKFDSQEKIIVNKTQTETNLLDLPQAPSNAIDNTLNNESNNSQATLDELAELEALMA